MSLGDVLQVIADATFVGAFVFGMVQVLSARRMRREQAAIETVHLMLSGPFAGAWRVVSELPAGITAADLEARGPQVTGAVDDMMMAFEPLGYLVFRRVCPLDIVNDLVGGVAVGSWERVRDYFLQSRQRMGNPALAEWFQWLAEQLAQHRDSTYLPAHERFKTWRG